MNDYVNSSPNFLSFHPHSLDFCSRLLSELFVVVFLMFIFERNGEKQSMSRGGAERERETQNQRQVPGSKLSAQSPMQGPNHEPQDHDLSRSWS